MQFMVLVAALLAFALGADASWLVGRGLQAHSAAEFRARLQPDVVARTLADVEGRWREAVDAFLTCRTAEHQSQCDSSKQTFLNSCSTVASVMLKASSGDRLVVKEYMSDICDEPVLQGVMRKSCFDFGGNLVDWMTEDSYTNRNEENLVNVPCTNFWNSFVASEEKSMNEERKNRAEEENRLAKERAEAERKAAEVQAERARLEAAEAKRRAEVEARRKAEEAKYQAEMAKREAAKAAAKLYAMKEEARRKHNEAKAALEKAQPRGAVHATSQNVKKIEPNATKVDAQRDIKKVVLNSTQAGADLHPKVSAAATASGNATAPKGEKAIGAPKTPPQTGVAQPHVAKSVALLRSVK